MGTTSDHSACVFFLKTNKCSSLSVILYCALYVVQVAGQTIDQFNQINTYIPNINSLVAKRAQYTYGFIEKKELRQSAFSVSRQMEQALDLDTLKNDVEFWNFVSVQVALCVAGEALGTYADDKVRDVHVAVLATLTSYNLPTCHKHCSEQLKKQFKR